MWNVTGCSPSNAFAGLSVSKLQIARMSDVGDQSWCLAKHSHEFPGIGFLNNGIRSGCVQTGSRKPSLNVADHRAKENQLCVGRGVPRQPYEFVTPHLPARVVGHEERGFVGRGSQAFYRLAFTFKNVHINKATMPRKHLNREGHAGVTV